MSCLRGRRNHSWGRRNGGKVHTGSFKLPDDHCCWCNKFRFEVKAEKRYQKSEDKKNCLQGRHTMYRRGRRRRVYRGMRKRSNDQCGWCGKYRFETEAEVEPYLERIEREEILREGEGLK